MAVIQFCKANWQGWLTLEWRIITIIVKGIYESCHRASERQETCGQSFSSHQLCQFSVIGKKPKNHCNRLACFTRLQKADDPRMQVQNKTHTVIYLIAPIFQRVLNQIMNFHKIHYIFRSVEILNLSIKIVRKEFKRDFPEVSAFGDQRPFSTQKRACASHTLSWRNGSN